MGATNFEHLEANGVRQLLNFGGRSVQYQTADGATTVDVVALVEPETRFEQDDFDGRLDIRQIGVSFLTDPDDPAYPGYANAALDDLVLIDGDTWTIKEITTKTLRMARVMCQRRIIAEKSRGGYRFRS